MVLSPEKFNENESIFLEGNWEYAFTSKRENIEVVETGVRTAGWFGFATSSSTKKWEQTENKKYLASLSRLVIIKDNEDNSVKSFIMTMIGESNYLEKKNFELWRGNTYLRKDKDFAGTILFHTLDGAFINGWQLRRGKVIGKVSQTFTTPQRSASKTTTCDTYEVTEYYEQCTDWYNVGETDDGNEAYYYTSTSCDYWDEVVGEYDVCYDDYSDEDDDTDPDVDDDYDGSGSGDGSTVQITFDSTFDNYPCQESIVESVYQNQSVLSNYILNIFNASATVNLTYKVGSIPGDYGQMQMTAINSELFNVDVTLGTNTATNGSDIFIASVMIHENVHAVLGAMAHQGSLTGVTINSSLVELAEAYTLWQESNSTTLNEHDYMMLLADQMADALKIYVESKDYTISDEYYNNIIWVGLKAATTYNSLSAIKKAGVDTAQINEYILPSGGGTKGVYPISNTNGTCQ